MSAVSHYRVHTTADGHTVTDYTLHDKDTGKHYGNREPGHTLRRDLEIVAPLRLLKLRNKDY